MPGDAAGYFERRNIEKEKIHRAQEKQKRRQIEMTEESKRNIESILRLVIVEVLNIVVVFPL